MLGIAVAAALVGLAVVSIARCPFLHPFQLWTLPWATAATLFATHLLPYRRIGLTTAVLIGAATVSYGAGVLLAARRSQAVPDLHRGWQGRTPGTGGSPLETAAGFALAFTCLGLAVFLAQLVNRFGLRASLVSAVRVRAALEAGVASAAIKYLYVAYAAAALCGMAAGACDNGPRRRRWLYLGGLAVLSQYFTTGRANIVLAALVLGTAESLARRRRPSPKRLFAVVGVIILFALVVFTVGGAIIGKTLGNSSLSRVPSPLTQHSVLRPVALPYEYATAPIAALDRLVRERPAARATLGCATFTVVCQLASSAGIDVTPVPAIRPFTTGPLAWNTYTAIDLPFLDGGPLFVVMFFLLAGAWVGLLWRRAQDGSPTAIGLYALYAPVILYSAVQNNFCASYVVGSALLFVLFMWIGVSTNGGGGRAYRHLATRWR